ncbi:MAG: hypothetical protein ACTIJ9_11320 [Aequorivita sp.]
MGLETIRTTYKNVSYMDNAINYQANIFTSACGFELYINDLPVFKHLEGTGISTSFTINTKILESGQQNFRIKILPPSTETEKLPSISQKAVFELTIKGVRFREKGLDNLGEVLTWEIPNDKNNYIEKNDKGNVYIEFEGTFQAKVPYSLKGWTNSKNLEKVNQEKLLKDVVAFYENFGSLLQNKKESKIIELIQNKEQEVAQSLFFKKEDSGKQWEAYTESFENPTFKIEPMENYKLFFYGNGKIVALERTDFYSYGESPLRAIVSENGEEFIENFPLRLHIPEGSDSLEIIR